MSDIPTLQALYTEAEAKHQQAIADNPLPRSPEEQAYVWAYEDALRDASRDLREAKKRAFCTRQDEVRAEVRAEFPNVEWS